MRGVSYTWRREEFTQKNFPAGEHIGVIAQEVEAILPELVSTDAQGYKSVRYANMVAVLIEAVKEQQQKIEALQNQQNLTLDLSRKIAELKANPQPRSSDPSFYILASVLLGAVFMMRRRG